MNRTTRIVLGLILVAVGAALIVYRIGGGSQLAEPLPIVLTVLAVGALFAGFGTLGKGLAPQQR